MNKPSTNDITGDTIQTKASNAAYRDGYDRIYNKQTKARCMSYDAQLSGGHYTFNCGLVAETDQIELYGLEASPFTSGTDAGCCTIGSMLLRESHIMHTGRESEWRDATDGELAEVNDDMFFIEDLVAVVVKDLTGN